MYRYNIILANSDQNEEKELTLLDTMLGKQVDGIVMMSEEVTEMLQRAVEACPVPIVLAGSISSTEKVASVNIDYYKAALEAVQILIDNGHTRIAFVSGPLQYTVNGERKLAAYKDALQKANIAIDEVLIVAGDGSYDDGLESWVNLSELENPPTAIFVGNDELAIGLVHGIQDSGKMVPEDVEIISFENSKLARMVRPQLTSVVLPLYDIGAVAMRLLTKYMNKEEVDDQHVILPHRIEQRDSSK